MRCQLEHIKTETLLFLKAMAIFDDFLNKLPTDGLKEVCLALQEEFLQYPNITILKKFNLPFFYGNTWICYLNFVKKNVQGTPSGEIEFLFVRARELPSKELLDFKDRVMVAGLTYKKVSDIDYGVLKLLLEEAIALDAEKSYTFIKKK